MALCYQCGMGVGADGAYHPYAACLMFKVCKDGDKVRSNLAAVEQHGAEVERARIRRELQEALEHEWWEPFRESFINALDRICPPAAIEGKEG